MNQPRGGRAEVIAQRFLYSRALGEKKNLKHEFERTALPHLSHLYTATVYLTKDRSEAEDLVQDTSLFDETLRKKE